VEVVVAEGEEFGGAQRDVPDELGVGIVEDEVAVLAVLGHLCNVLGKEERVSKCAFG